MKPQFKLLLGVSVIAAIGLSTYAQGTAFTYQGRLTDGANPASGLYDLRFALFDAASAGAQQGNLLTNSATVVSNGLFTVTLDFGNQFPGANRWLEIAVRTNGGSAFTTLTARQPLTAAPYAVFASSAAALSASSTQPVSLSVNGTNVLRITLTNDPFYGVTANSVGGSPANVISNGFYGSFIGGGGSAAFPNRVGANFASVLGGLNNTASGMYAAAMGSTTTASGSASTAMGFSTTASGGYATAMGVFNLASGYASTASGTFSTASGFVSTALGYGAKAIHDGSFVWSDNSGGEFYSSGDNQFCIRAAGGMLLDGSTKMYFGSTLSQKIHLYGADWAIGIQSGTQYYRVGAGGMYAWYAGGTHNNNTLNSGGGTTLMTLGSGGLTVNGTFVSASDRNLKENFQPVDAQEVLRKVAALPLSRWNYKADKDSEHIGPMAQDFHAAFGVGPDDKHITTVDEGGVALAAIQGLNEKLEATRVENAELKQELAQLKTLVEKLAQKK